MPNSIIPVRFDGGVNLLVDPRKLPDNELAWAKNLVPTVMGSLSKRRGSQYTRTLGVSSPLAAAYCPFETALEWVYVNDASIHIGNDAGGLTYTHGLSGAGLYRQPAIIPFANKVYIFLGYPDTNAGYIVQKDPLAATGVAVSAMTWSTAGNSTAIPSVAIPYRSRILYGNFGPGYEQYLGISDRFSPADIPSNLLAANGWNFWAGPSDGDAITGGIEVLLTEGEPATAACLVFKENSAYMIRGEPLEQDDSGATGREAYFNDLVVGVMPENCGCISPATIVRTPYGVLWAGPDDVWLFSAGQMPRRVGTKIRPALRRQPASYRYLTHAAYFDGFYRLALLAEGQGATRDSLCEEQWWLDLRNGPPNTPAEAQWWGPVEYTHQTSGATKGTRAMVVEVRAGQPATLKALTVSQALELDVEIARDVKLTAGSIFDPTWANATPYTEDYLLAGTLGEQVICIQAGTSGGSEPTWPSNPGETVTDGSAVWARLPTISSTTVERHTVTDSEIATELRSKEFTLDSMLDKLVAGVELSAWNGEQAQLQAKLIIDGGRRIETCNEYLEQDGFDTTVDALDAADPLIARTFKSVGVFPSATSRPTGKSVQLRLADVPGYVVTDDSDEFVFWYKQAGVETEYVVALAHGNYGALADFLTYIVGLMNTAIDAAIFSHNQATATHLTVIRTDNDARTWTPNFEDATGTATASQKKKTRRVGAMLGFNTERAMSYARYVVAEELAYNKRVSMLEYSDLNLIVRGMRRRPK